MATKYVNNFQFGRVDEQTNRRPTICRVFQTKDVLGLVRYAPGIPSLPFSFFERAQSESRRQRRPDVSEMNPFFGAVAVARRRRERREHQHPCQQELRQERQQVTWQVCSRVTGSMAGLIAGGVTDLASAAWERRAP